MTLAVSVISSMATRHILADLAALHQRATSQTVNLLPLGGVDAAKRVRAGEAFDLVVLAEDAIRQLETEGHVVAGSVRPFAVSQTAVAVKDGAPSPRTCDEATLRVLLAAAPHIAISTGPSGVGVRKLLSAWGITDATRIVQAPPGVPVARLLVANQAVIGFQQRSELLGEAGITIIGDVPPALLPTTTFSMGLCRLGAGRQSAEAFAKLLLSPDAASAKTMHGMSQP